MDLGPCFVLFHHNHHLWKVIYCVNNYFSLKLLFFGPTLREFVHSSNFSYISLIEQTYSFIINYKHRAYFLIKNHRKWRYFYFLDCNIFYSLHRGSQGNKTHCFPWDQSLSALIVMKLSRTSNFIGSCQQEVNMNGRSNSQCPTYTQKLIFFE